MSWSYSYKGDAKAAADHINAGFSAHSITAQPEKVVHDSVQAILLNALTNWKPDVGIQIEAWGSQNIFNGEQTNSLHVDIAISAIEAKAE